MRVCRQTIRENSNSGRLQPLNPSLPCPSRPRSSEPLFPGYVASTYVPERRAGIGRWCNGHRVSFWKLDLRSLEAGKSQERKEEGESRHVGFIARLSVVSTDSSRGPTKQPRRADPAKGKLTATPAEAGNAGSGAGSATITHPLAVRSLGKASAVVRSGTNDV